MTHNKRHKKIGELVTSLKEVPGERYRNLSDLIAVLTHYQSDDSHRKEWYSQFYKFAKHEPCMVRGLSNPKDVFAPEKITDEELLGKMIENVGKLSEGALGAISDMINEGLAVNRGVSCYKELRAFLDRKRECHWIEEKVLDKKYLQHFFDLRADSYRLSVYKLIRKGQFKQILHSLRDGELSRISFPSLAVVQNQFRRFADRLGEIKGNEGMFFPFYNKGEVAVVYLDISYLPISAEEKLFLDDDTVWEPGVKKGFFVVMNLP